MTDKDWRLELLDYDLDNIRAVADDMDELRKKLWTETRLEIEYLVDLQELIKDLRMYIRLMDEDLEPLDQEFKLTYKSKLRSLLTRN